MTREGRVELGPDPSILPGRGKAAWSFGTLPGSRRHGGSVPRYSCHVLCVPTHAVGFVQLSKSACHGFRKQGVEAVDKGGHSVRGCG